MMLLVCQCWCVCMLLEANCSGAQVAIIIGSNELEAGQVVIRPMNSGEQYSVNREDLVAAIQNEVSKIRSAN